MFELENEVKKRKTKALIEELTRITADIKLLESKLEECEILLKENIIIDDKTYQEEMLNEIDNEIETISGNIKNIIIPSLTIELNE